MKVVAEPHANRPQQSKVKSGLTVLWKLCCRCTDEGHWHLSGRDCGRAKKSFLEGTILELWFEGQAGTAKQKLRKVFLEEERSVQVVNRKMYADRKLLWEAKGEEEAVRNMTPQVNCYPEPCASPVLNSFYFICAERKQK